MKTIDQLMEEFNIYESSVIQFETYHRVRDCLELAIKESHNNAIKEILKQSYFVDDEVPYEVVETYYIKLLIKK